MFNSCVEYQIVCVERTMAKYRPYDYSQRVMIPISLSINDTGDIGFAIHTLVEDRMDISVLRIDTTNDENGTWLMKGS